MTAAPEAALARELGLFLTSVALVTDLDAGLEHGEGVTHDEVLRVFAENVGTVRDLLVDAVARLPAADADCSCRRALDGQKLPFDLP
jgi:5'-methylthioadenosine phosphorylase